MHNITQLNISIPNPSPEASLPLPDPFHPPHPGVFPQGATNQFSMLINEEKLSQLVSDLLSVFSIDEAKTSIVEWAHLAKAVKSSLIEKLELFSWSTPANIVIPRHLTHFQVRCLQVEPCAPSYTFCKDLQQAMATENLEQVQKLLRKGVKLYSPDNPNADTALHFALKNKVNLDIILELIKASNGEVLVRKDAYGDTPLKQALVQNMHPEILDLLIERSLAYADEVFGTRDLHGDLPLHTALEKVTDKNTLLKLIRIYDLNFSDQFDFQNFYSETFLHKTLSSQIIHEPEVLNNLIQATHRNTPDAFQIQNQKERTPLHLAALCNINNDSFQRILTYSNEALSIQDANKKTPLQIAIETTRDKAVIRLIEATHKHAPDALKARSALQNTLLHLAVIYERSFAIAKKIILCSNTLFSATNKDGKTFFQLAFDKGADDELLYDLSKISAEELLA